MFDFGIGTPELLMIAIVALLVVGPKDLPKLLKTIGNYIGKIKDMAREFQGHVDEATKEAGVDELKTDLSDAMDFDFEEDFKKQEAELTKVFEDAATTPDDPPSTPVKKPAKKAAAKKAARKITKKPVKKIAAKKPAKRVAAKKAAKPRAAKKSKAG